MYCSKCSLYTNYSETNHSLWFRNFYTLSHYIDVIEVNYITNSNILCYVYYIKNILNLIIVPKSAVLSKL